MKHSRLTTTCLILGLLLVAALAGTAGAQQGTNPTVFDLTNDKAPAGVGPARSTPAAPSLPDFRLVGETRIWNFFAKGQPCGRLTSRVAPPETWAGQRSNVLYHGLQIDFSRFGAAREIGVLGKTFLGDDGRYLGTEYEFPTTDPRDSLVLTVAGSKITGHYTREKSPIPREGSFPAGQLPWDHFFVDQLEIYLALHDINVGDSLIDTLYDPQTMAEIPVRAEVKWWMWQEIWKGYIDSVYIIRFAEPSGIQAYFTEDRRLIRLDYNNQGLRAYQDMVQAPTAASTAPAARPQGQDEIPTMTPSVIERVQSRESYGFVNFVAGLPHYIAYLLVALLVVVLLTRRAFGWIDSYVFFVVGAVIYAVTPFTLKPLVEYVLADWYVPGINAGGSFFAWGALPAAIVSVVQTVLITLALYGLFMWRNPKAVRYGYLGVFLGVAFGVAEACFQLGMSVEPLFSWVLFERAFWVVFHGAMAGLIGLGIFRGRNQAIAMIVLSVAANGWLRYIPVFVQTQTFDLELARIVIAAGSVVILIYAVLSLGSRVAVRADSTKE